MTVAVGEERRRSKPVGPSPGQEEEQPVCLSLGHHCGSRGEEEEEQTSGAESGAGRGATSGSKSGASPWQLRRRGGGANQWVQVRGRRRSNQCVRVWGITVAAGEERRKSKLVGPSPGHHRGSRGGEEEEQTSGFESWASP